MRAGTRLQSVVSETEVIVTRVGEEAVEAELACGGSAMVEHGQDAPRQELAGDGATQMGKRYVNDARGIEVLCTKGGEGTLTIDGEPLALKGAKPLPASD